MVLLLCLYINSIGTERSFGKYQVLKKIGMNKATAALEKENLLD
jgi:hypothetical protein